MVFDSVADKKMVLHVIANFQMNGPYGKVSRAVRELDALTRRVEQSVISTILKTGDGSKKAPTSLKEVK